MNTPEIDKKTGEAHDIHGSPMPGQMRGARIGEGGEYYREDDHVDSNVQIEEHDDHQANDETAIGLIERVLNLRSKGVGFEDESDSRTSGLVTTNL